MRAIALVAMILALAGCNRNTAIGNDREAQLEAAPSPAPVMAPEATLANVSPALVKPETMSVADLSAVGGLAGRCAVRLTELAYPSFVFAPGGTGTIKLNGKLVPLPAAGEGRFARGDLSVLLRPRDERGDAGLSGMDMIVLVPGAEDELGYAGFVDCTERNAT
ncbi:DUF6692 family protein [Erythrobacter sp.]|uniref:DUF6692 family protein n=1 Tax=Erythrobacter sp. TaxID=1042 RepID=UPI001425FF3B|nr:DUF6692 family protein [Erythrobacter sp.]QIQ85259.1 MAG: hypothetical protein G9473_00115 [Erythrobacter sp.]QIQ88010.1 MAG: hypothetical protein G9473_15880 [Erythrobacter sp.]